MFQIAIKMLMEDKTKYIGLLIGISFTAFLVTFAMAYFAGFMTRGFALVSENPTADIWVMDSAVSSTEATINMSDSALYLVKSIQGVDNATPLYLEDMTARYPNGHFQSFQIIGVDDATLSGAPKIKNGLSVFEALHIPQSIIVDSGGTSDKLQTPVNQKDIFPFDGSHLDVPTRELRFGDELLIDSRRVVVSGVSQTIPRFPPRPLIYTTISNFKRLTPSQSKRVTFVMVRVTKGVSAQAVAKRIQKQTGLKALTGDKFKKQTVMWFFINSEDVGDMVNMVILAMLVGFGVTGVMLYMFTQDNAKQYALLKAIGATYKQLRAMIFTQVFVSGMIGSGIGIGIDAIVGELISGREFPYRLMWFAPLFGIFGVLIVSITAGFISTRAVSKIEPEIVFSGQ
jgi:putative ABC transport system permease protein